MNDTVVFFFPPHPSSSSSLFSSTFYAPFLPQQARLDFRDPLMVSLEFGLANEDQGPVLDESLPRSINKTVGQFHITY